MTGDDERFEGFELFDEVSAPDQWDAIARRAERQEAAPTPGRRWPWLLVAAAAAVAFTGVVVLANRGNDDGDIATVTTPDTAPTLPPAEEPLPPPGALECRDASALAEIAARMPYTGGIPYDYRIAPDLARLVGRSRIVATATIDSMEVDGRFTVLELSDVHVLTGVLSTTLASVAAPGQWTQERDRVRFDGLEAVLFLHRAELVAGAEWIPDIQGIVIGCDGADGTAQILEPLPDDADVSSVGALAADVLAVNRPRSPGMTCTDDAALAEIVEVLRAGVPVYDYDSVEDLGELVDKSAAVLAVTIDAVHAAPGGYAELQISDVELLAGDADPGVAAIGYTAGRGSSVTFDGLRAVVFLHQWSEARGGWSVDIQGLLVACAAGSAGVTSVIEPLPPTVDLRSLEGVAAAVRSSVDPQPQGWSPPCTELRTPSTPPTGDDPQLDTFGPLGRGGLDIRLPLGRSARADVPSAPTVAVARVPGGLITLVRPSSSDWFDSAIVARVDHDGTLRWRRCLDDVSVGWLLAGPTVALVVTTPGGGDPESLAFDVSTGESVEPPDGVDDLAARAFGDRYTLLGRYYPDDAPIDVGQDRLAVFDRETGVITDLPYRAAADGQPPDFVDFRFADDTILHLEHGVIAAAYDGQAWRTDRDSILALTDVEAVYDYENGGWAGRNGVGEVLWRHPELLDVGGEGFRSASTEGVTILNACLDLDEAGFCLDEVFVGLDTATGEILWRQPYRRAVAAAGDGVALVTTGDDAHILIDVHTGELVDDTQVWPGVANFQQGCCGEGEFLWVGRGGGVLWAVDYDRVTVVYPQGVADGTVRIDLAG